MRLNAYLARTGVASRRGADELIKTGRVRVNGVRGQLNTFVKAGDVVDLDGRLLVPQELAYVLLHKPAGVVTTAPIGCPLPIGLPSVTMSGTTPSWAKPQNASPTRPNPACTSSATQSAPAARALAYAVRR